MSRIYCIIGCIALVVLVAGVASAETPRVFGMGDTYVAVDNTASAWSGNPALLPLVDDAPPGAGSWPGVAALTVAMDDNFSYQSIDTSLHSDSRRGFGAGYQSIDGFVDIYGAGYGQRCGLFENLFVGLNGMYVDDPWDEEFIMSLGLAYQAPVRRGTVTAGLTIWDLFNRWDTQYDLGVAYTNSGFTFAVDLWDDGDWNGVGLGAEYRRDPFSVRIGSSDGDFTAGAEYRYREFGFSVAYQDWGFDDIFLGGAHIQY